MKYRYDFIIKDTFNGCYKHDSLNKVIVMVNTTEVSNKNQIYTKAKQKFPNIYYQI